MKHVPTEVVKSRFEVEQDGAVAYLEFETDGHGWMTLWHTEVPMSIRHQGIGLELVTAAFDYARERSLKVDVICPMAQSFIAAHPEFQPLVAKR